MPSNRRDHLVDTAARMFYRDGYHATGIDSILAEAGVAKMTLYNHFKSKDELILAALRRRDEEFRNRLMREVERRAHRPEDRVLALFDVLDEWFADPDFNGCAFINAAAEFPGPDDPVHRACAEHKRLVRRYIETLARAAGAADPEDLAAGLMLLIEGAIVQRHAAGRLDAARRARRAAAVLLRDALASPWRVEEPGRDHV